MASEKASDEGVQKVRELVGNAQVAMLTTISDDGKLLSRPMGLQQAEFDGDLWFFADEHSELVPQIRANPTVNVSFVNSKNTEWTSVSGQGEIVHDRAKAEELYSKPLDAWFNQGLDTPGLVLLKVHADGAEYWEAPGSKVVTLLGIARAAITRDQSKGPDTRNEEIDL